MNFKQIVIHLDGNETEKLSDIFFELGVLSVSIEDLHAGTSLEEPLFGEPDPHNLDNTSPNFWKYSKISVLVADTEDIASLMAATTSLFNQQFSYEVETIANEDWVRKTQSQFAPIAISNNLYIVPSWHTPPDKNATIITLDPGLAFGTGSHPTTYMCLKWLAHNYTNINSLVDYGCGSGIIAITAKKLGVPYVYGTDIDQQAIEASNNNAQKNQIEIDFVLPEALPDQQFAVTIANILPNPLRILAPTLAKITSKKLILSGILAAQSQELKDIYSNYFVVEIVDHMDEWVLLECRKENK